MNVGGGLGSAEAWLGGAEAGLVNAADGLGGVEARLGGAEAGFADLGVRAAAGGSINVPIPR
ncbi:MAG: hypothetical protein LBD24_00315 [Spirochaetaceae bacterium]|nr:hypothetical protein [Spirochaetaceae bacterium]